ncbi:MAG: protein-disulfide reductase DsbD N-terminal domain-containing protein [Rhodocyclaceae bacterium]|nr:protein-disulfide reductase DsbD N-terminal domain-containing protein [Rhodocyclaceae bacterium]
MLAPIMRPSTYKLALALISFASTALGNSLAVPAAPSAVNVFSSASPSTNEVLDPAVAFQPQFRMRDATSAEIKFDVVPGYYLYRDRIRVEGVVVEPQVGGRGGKPTPDTPGAVTPLVVAMPVGRFVDDPTFGRVEIYDRSVVLHVDLAASAATPKSAGANNRRAAGKLPNKFRLTSQGCAAAGVCFPPQQHEFALPATVSGSRDARTTDSAWVLPIAAAASLGFGPLKKPSASKIPSK